MNKVSPGTQNKRPININPKIIQNFLKKLPQAITTSKNSIESGTNNREGQNAQNNQSKRELTERSSSYEKPVCKAKKLDNP